MSLRRDSIYNLLGNLIPLLAAAITIPYLLSNLGSEKFGVLSLIWALIGYFGVFDLGVGRALTYEVSRRLKNEAEGAINRTIKAGLGLTLITGFLGSLLVYFVIARFGASWFKISTELHNEVKLAFEITALGIIPTTLTSGLRGILEGFGRFLEPSINRLVLGTLMFLLPAVSVWYFQADLYVMAIYLISARYLVCGLALFQVRRQVFNKVSFRIDDMKPLVNFGAWVTISGLISPLMVYGDRFFVSATVGVEALPLYAIPQEGLQRLLIIPAALATALMPRMASVYYNKPELITMYSRNLHRVAIVMFFVCAGAALIAAPVLSLWLSEDFAKKSLTIVYVLCIGLWFNSMAQLPMTFLYATGNPKLAAITHIVELFFYVILVFVLSNSFGIAGAAFAWSIRVTLDFMILHYFSKKYIN